MGSPSPDPAPPSAGTLCAICQWPIRSGEAGAECPECRADYHAECWEENGGCAVYGCSRVPPTEPRAAVEIPVSYWGQEHKPCPACGAEILAAAVRCRNCGATFAEARPEDPSRFRERMALKQRQPSLRRQAVWLLVFSALTCTAPLAALIGIKWYFSHRHELRELPRLYAGLARIALAVGIGQSLLIILMSVLFSTFRC